MKRSEELQIIEERMASLVKRAHKVGMVEIRYLVARIICAKGHGIPPIGEAQSAIYDLNFDEWKDLATLLRAIDERILSE